MIKRKPKTNLIVAALTGLVLAVFAWFGAKELYVNRLCQTAYDAKDAGERQEACARFERYLELRPNDGQALQDYCELRTTVALPNQSHLQKASNALRSLTDLQPQNVGAWLSYSQVCIALGEYNTAHTAARQVLRLDEANVDATLALASHELRLGAHQKTLSILREFVERFPEQKSNWRICLLTFSALREIGGGNVAIQDEFEEYISISSALEEKLFLMAYVRFLDGKKLEAETHLAELFAIGIETPEVLQSALELCDELQLQDLATRLVPENCSESIRKQPLAALWLARRCWQLGMPETIVELFEGQRIDPAIQGEINYLLVAGQLALERKAAALALMKSMAQNQVDCASQRWSSLAQATFDTAVNSKVAEQVLQLANPSEVIKQCESVLEVSPDSPVPQMLQALAYSRLGENQVAGQISHQLTRRYDYWFQPHHICTASYLLAGRMDAAQAISIETLKRFPKDDNAILTYYLIEACLLSPQDKVRANFLIDLAERIQITSEDLRNMDIALIKTKAFLTLGRTVEAEKALAKWGTIDGLDVLLKTAVLARSNAMAAKRYQMNRPKNVQSSTQSRSPEDSYLESLRKLNEMLENGDSRDSEIFALLRKLELESPGQAVLWRLTKAEWLLRDTSEKNAAQAVLLLAPIAKVKGGIADAHILTGIALARLHDEALATEHFVIATQQIPKKATQVLRLSLGLRKNAQWHDPVLLAQLWESSAMSIGRLSTSEHTQGVVDRMILLAEFAEQNEDLDLADVVYRRLIGMDPSLHFAHNNLAYTLLRKKKGFEEALKLSNMALRADPQNQDYQNTLAEIESAISLAAN